MQLLQTFDTHVTEALWAGASAATQRQDLSNSGKELADLSSKIPALAALAETNREMQQSAGQSTVPLLLKLVIGARQAYAATANHQTLEGEFEPFDKLPVSTNASALAPKVAYRLMETLRSKKKMPDGVGQLLALPQVAGDSRLWPAMIHALGNPYNGSCVADAFGNASPLVLPMLQESFNPKGKAADANCLMAMAGLLREDGAELYRSCLREGSQQIQLAALACLRYLPDGGRAELEISVKRFKSEAAQCASLRPLLVAQMYPEIFSLCAENKGPRRKLREMLNDGWDRGFVRALHEAISNGEPQAMTLGAELELQPRDAHDAEVCGQIRNYLAVLLGQAHFAERALERLLALWDKDGLQLVLDFSKGRPEFSRHRVDAAFRLGGEAAYEVVGRCVEDWIETAKADANGQSEPFPSVPWDRIEHHALPLWRPMLTRLIPLHPLEVAEALRHFGDPILALSLLEYAEKTDDSEHVRAACNAVYEASAVDAIPLLRKMAMKPVKKGVDAMMATWTQTHAIKILGSVGGQSELTFFDEVLRQFPGNERIENGIKYARMGIEKRYA